MKECGIYPEVFILQVFYVRELQFPTRRAFASPPCALKSCCSLQEPAVWGRPASQALEAVKESEQEACGGSSSGESAKG